MSVKDQNIVHCVGIGTIGLPLVGLLTRYKKQFGIDEVSFHKNVASRNDINNVKQLIKNGAIFSTDLEKYNDFEAMGVNPKYSREDAIQRASVVIDCTPKGFGNKNKIEYYQKFKEVKGFIAQGSETGFGKPFAFNINNEALKPIEDQFIQVVSCNTHNICALLNTFKDYVSEGRFVCMRRASDISQNDDYVAGVTVDPHKESFFGTHHARDAFTVLQTVRKSYRIMPDLYSSSCVLPTQYMHTIHFNLVLDCFSESFKHLDSVITAFRENTMVALTNKNTSNSVFSFGRDYGHYGRILNQTVISLPTLQSRSTPRGRKEVSGFCFTPQDGNSLLSSVAATLWYLYHDWVEVENRMECLSPYLFQEI